MKLNIIKRMIFKGMQVFFLYLKYRTGAMENVILPLRGPPSPTYFYEMMFANINIKQ